MDMTRLEIMPGVWLNALRTDKFKTGCLSATLLTQLDKDTASMNALIPFVLRRGTVTSPDMDALSARLDGMYGAAIEPVVRRIGEIQCTGLYASFPEDRYLPAGADEFARTAQLTAEMLLAPNTRGGLLLPSYVDSEKSKLIELIRSRVNDRQGYALQRCIQEMCCCEAYSVLRFGDEETAEAIHYQKLTKHYHDLLSRSPIELFYCGSAPPEEAARVLREAFSTLPRGDIDYDIGTEIRMNSLEEKPRETVETLDVSQGKLVIGFRLGECMENADKAPMRVFNAVYGSGVTSKLFTNVRERLSLCYYASSILETHKGLMFVSSGIDEKDFAAARDEILAQLDAVRRGEISDYELSAAKSCFASDMRAVSDSQSELESYYLANAVDGAEVSPAELAALSESVTKEQVAQIARGIECDEIYFLRGSGEDSDGE